MSLEPVPHRESEPEASIAPRSRAYPWIQLLLRVAVNLFFRRVEVGGLRNIPAEGGGLVVSWHPNGLAEAATPASAFAHESFLPTP